MDGPDVGFSVPDTLTTEGVCVCIGINVDGDMLVDGIIVISDNNDGAWLALLGSSPVGEPFEGARGDEGATVAPLSNIVGTMEILDGERL